MSATTPDLLARIFTNIDASDEARIRALLATGEVTVQFSEAGYDQRLLCRIDALGEEFGDRLMVRFYGFYGRTFDASCLRWLPHVRRLAIDTITQVSSIEAVFALPALRELSLGIMDLNRADLLGHLPLETLTRLALSQTRRSELDLAPLARARALQSLHLTGHTRNFDVLAQLRKVRELSLRSIPKKQSLAAVSAMPALRKIRLIVGGRETIAELAHPRLTDLEIGLVLGLRDLGDLARFPALRDLLVTDQNRLAALDLGRASPELRRVVIVNCKALRRIGSVTGLRKLQHLRVLGTAVDYEALLAAPLPRSLKIVRFTTGKNKQDRPMEQRLAELGYRSQTSNQAR